MWVHGMWTEGQRWPEEPAEVQHWLQSHGYAQYTQSAESVDGLNFAMRPAIHISLRQGRRMEGLPVASLQCSSGCGRKLGQCHERQQSDSLSAAARLLAKGPLCPYRLKLQKPRSSKRINAGYSNQDAKVVSLRRPLRAGDPDQRCLASTEPLGNLATEIRTDSAAKCCRAGRPRRCDLTRSHSTARIHPCSFG